MILLLNTRQRHPDYRHEHEDYPMAAQARLMSEGHLRNGKDRPQKIMSQL